MRNKEEEGLRKMSGKIFHVKVVAVYPATEGQVDVVVEFLEGPLQEEHLTIDYNLVEGGE